MLYDTTTAVNAEGSRATVTIVDDILASGGGPGTLTVPGSRTGAADADAVTGWARLHQRALRTASALAEAGIGAGSRVGLLGDPGIDLVTALQAVWLAGAAITVLPRPARRATAHALAPVVADAGLDLVIMAPDLVPAATALPVRLAPLPELTGRAAAAPPLAVRPPDPADLAVLQYTSGSTRVPRGVPVTHAHLAANLAALREVFQHGLRHPHPIVSWLPLYHDMGLVGFLGFAMSAGYPLVLQSPAGFALRPASWLEAVSRFRAVATGAPDSAYRLVTPLLEAGADLDLRAVRFMLTGGEPVSPATMTRFVAAASRYGLDPASIVPAYGLAESTLTVTCSPPGTGLATDSVDQDSLERAGRAIPARAGGRVRTLTRLGRPVRGTRLRIVDPGTGAPVREREVGEVQIRGASVVGHYWGEPPPPAGSWLRTGDLGYLAGGDLVVCGRAKDVLFAAGRNLYPQDIESVAGQVPGVRPGGVVAFGLVNEDGDRLVVVVESRERDRPELCRAVAVAVTAEIGMRPAHVIALPPGRLPRTTSGKLRRAEVRRRYRAGELAVIPKSAPVNRERNGR
jgi:fatty-acyl-CoA synthase